MISDPTTLFYLGAGAFICLGLALAFNYGFNRGQRSMLRGLHQDWEHFNSTMEQINFPR